MRIITTGGAGFIGSNFLRQMIKKHPNYTFVNIDKLTYSGNYETIKEFEFFPNYLFIKEDICNFEKMLEIIREGDVVVNFAAESHVDNSISDPSVFVKTNILGTHNLLEAARKNKAKLFIQISTDEVYGSLNFNESPWTEDSPLNPKNPYSSTKAAAELICLGNMKTFNQPIIITRSSNNFGPYQFPEKVIPLFVTNLIRGKKVPLYGEGKNMRDWLYVSDNCEAIDIIIHKGSPGQIYNIGGGNEVSNIELTKKIIALMGKDDSFIERVVDRKGHDLRYALHCSKVSALGWSPKFDFDSALSETVDWYKKNIGWWQPLKDMAGRRTG